MAKLHKVGNQDKRMGIEEELDTRKQQLEEEDSWEVAIFKCINNSGNKPMFNCEERREQSSSKYNITVNFYGLLHFGGNPFME